MDAPQKLEHCSQNTLSRLFKKSDFKPSIIRMISEKFKRAFLTQQLTSHIAFNAAIE